MAPSNQHTAKTCCLDGMKIILSQFDLTPVTMCYYCLFHAAEVLIVSLLQFLQFFPANVCLQIYNDDGVFRPVVVWIARLHQQDKFLEFCFIEIC